MTLFGIFTFVRAVQPLKRQLEKDVMPSGIDTLTREVQLAKQVPPMEVTLSGTVILVRELQRANAVPLIFVGASGNVILVRELQLRKHEVGITSRFFGKVKFPDMPEQPLKTSAPIEVILSGSVGVARALQ